jgi:hypothetical protein
MFYFLDNPTFGRTRRLRKGSIFSNCIVKFSKNTQIGYIVDWIFARKPFTQTQQPFLSSFLDVLLGVLLELQLVLGVGRLHHLLLAADALRGSRIVGRGAPLGVALGSVAGVADGARFGGAADGLGVGRGKVKSVLGRLTLYIV